MHQCITITTTAVSNDDATGNAQALFEGRDPPLRGPFDYGKTMNNGARWSDSMPDVVQETGSIRADTDGGIELIEDAWESQLSALERNFAVVETALSDGLTVEALIEDICGPMVETDVEAWNPLGLSRSEDELPDTYTADVRHAMYTLGKYEGPDICCYTEHGEAIRTAESYNDLRESVRTRTGRFGADELPDDIEWYVTPVDVHC